MNGIEPPIFVVGCSHSGTSLMLAILGAHSKIHAIRHETGVMLEKKIKATKVYNFRTATIETGKDRWVEKTAEHIRQVDRIFRTFPKAKVIAMLRDGRDVAASIYARTGDFGSAVIQWVETCEVINTWKGYTNFLTVKYENLVTDFEGTMKEVFRFLGEEYEEGVKDFHEYYPEVEKPLTEDDDHHVQLRTWQLGQPLYDGSGRWKKEFGRRGTEIMNELAGEMLVEMGYA